jgi:hypothetical protein
MRSNGLNTRAVQTLVAGLEFNATLEVLELQSNDVSMTLMVRFPIRERERERERCF